MLVVLLYVPLRPYFGNNHAYTVMAAGTSRVVGHRKKKGRNKKG